MTFPNTNQVAHFDPRSQLVFLDKYRAKDIEQDYKEGKLSNLRVPLSTVYHELNHWADCVGTVWGNKYLHKIYQSFDVLPTVKYSGSEVNFYKFLEVHDQDRKLSYDDYYRVHHTAPKAHSHKRTWRIEFSSGVEFSVTGRPDEKNPIIFVKFRDRDSERLIIRQPLCVASILETTSVWSEMLTQILLIRATDGPEKVVDMVLMEREFLDRLYAEELTLYSAPVHLMAHFASISETIDAYRMAALVAFVTLNLVSSHFRQIKTTKSMDAWSDRFSAFRKNESIPFAFFCICAGAPKWSEELTPFAWLEAALRNAGLPTFDEILSHAVKVLKKDSESCQRKDLAKHQVYLRELGIKWLHDRWQRKDPAVGLPQVLDLELCTPPIFDSEGNLFKIFGSKFDTGRFDPKLIYDVDASLHTQILNLRSACR